MCVYITYIRWLWLSDDCRRGDGGSGSIRINLFFSSLLFEAILSFRLVPQGERGWEEKYGRKRSIFRIKEDSQDYVPSLERKRREGWSSEAYDLRTWTEVTLAICSCPICVGFQKQFKGTIIASELWNWKGHRRYLVADTHFINL